MPISFSIEKVGFNGLARAGVLKTPHGDIHTPAFVVVGTNATVKALLPEEVKSLGGQIVLGNTYHLYLEPGQDIIKKAGGMGKFMNWHGPTVTDSGGFQAFSLGAAYGKSISKIWRGEEDTDSGGIHNNAGTPLAKVTEEGVLFKSHRDGSRHFFTPEKSIKIQHDLGADIIFAFDECTSPQASYEYQREAMERTHKWAQRCLDTHKQNKKAMGQQGLFGIVQGGQFKDLRKESARVIGGMDFYGFGLGGSYKKSEISDAVGWITEILPPNKPRHFLGIGEPEDLFHAVEQGIDLFDCVAPTRQARNGALYTKNGRINILNAKFRRDLTPIEDDCKCFVCKQYSRAYVAHLFRTREILGLRLASMHNLHFIISMVDKMRVALIEDTFSAYKDSFLKSYYAKEKI